MKNILKFAAIVLVMATFFTSCKKETSDFTKNLRKIVCSYGKTINLEYDAKGRITKVSDSYSFNGPPYPSIATFFYSGDTVEIIINTNNSIRSIIGSVNDYGYISKLQTEFSPITYEYNSDGYLIKITYPSQNSVYKITEGNRSSSICTAGTHTSSCYCSFYKGIESSVDVIEWTISDPGHLWDTFINLGCFGKKSKNPIKTAVYTSFDQLSYTIYYSYEYDKDGYITKAVATGNFEGSFTFTYE